MNSARWRAAGFLTEDSSGDPFFLPGGTPKEETLCQLVSGFFEKVFLAETHCPLCGTTAFMVHVLPDEHC